jgi:galactose-1-phosphate uridylyltransferase
MIEFRRLVESSTYMNPLDHFEPYEGKVEIRWDPLTGLTARIVHFASRRAGRFNPEGVLASSRAATCPFCPENVNRMTGRLDRTIFGSEQIEQGEVRIVPNLLTFDKYSLVAIISGTHYLDMGALVQRGSLAKGITALLEAFSRIREKDERARYFSINCNYMPMSGGSLVHPHMHGIAGEWPTNYHRIMLEKSREFSCEAKSVFWEALEEQESLAGERSVAATGHTFWYTPFAPKGNIDVGCIFREPSFFSLGAAAWADFGRGLDKVLTYMDRENVPGFNLSLFSAPDGEGHFRVNGRCVARRFLPPVNAADASYFEKIHMESVCLIAPEEVAGKLREMW